MNVDNESNRSVNMIASIGGTSARRSAPRISRARNADEKSGVLVSVCGGLAYPSSHSSAVTAEMAARNASGLLRRISTAAMTMASSRNAAR